MLKNNIICKKFKGSPKKQGIAPLLRDGIIESLSFLTCKIVFGSPIYIRAKTGSKKSLYCLSHLPASRSNHLEVVSNFSTKALSYPLKYIFLIEDSL